MNLNFKNYNSNILFTRAHLRYNDIEKQSKRIEKDVTLI